MEKLDLQNVTLACASSYKIDETLKAIEICKNYANFNKVILFSDIDTEYTVKIQKLESRLDYSTFIYYALPDYIKTDFVLSVQWDGFIVNPNSWTSEFFNYDYIGAPWGNVCGNGGFCLKSKKFLESQKVLSKQYKLEKDIVYADHGWHDDVMLCLKLRDKFIDMGCEYAPIDIGYKFSTEYGKYEDNNSFGFHDFRQHPQFKNLIYGKDL
jgi:hypothetical protein